MSLVLAALLEQTFLNSQLAGGSQQPRLTLNLGPVSPADHTLRSKGRKFERQRPMSQPWLQKLTRESTLLLKWFWMPTVFCILLGT